MNDIPGSDRPLIDPRGTDPHGTDPPATGPPATDLRAANRELLRWAATVRSGAATRTAGLPSWVLLIELFLGLGWLRAAAEKVIDPQWWTGDVIRGFVLEHQDQALGWYRPFLDAVVSPAALLVALAVLVLQLTAGLSLVTGRRRGLALGLGILLNLHFMAAGAVNPSVFYLLAQATLALWMVEQRPTITSTRRLVVVSAIATVLASASLPFISTLHPAHVIEDAAVMFVFGGALTIVACAQAGTTINAARRATRRNDVSHSGPSLGRRPS